MHGMFLVSATTNAKFNVMVICMKGYTIPTLNAGRVGVSLNPLDRDITTSPHKLQCEAPNPESQIYPTDETALSGNRIAKSDLTNISEFWARSPEP